MEDQINSTPTEDLPEAFLTPEQRQDAIAQILTDISIRIIKKRHETSTYSAPSPHSQA